MKRIVPLLVLVLPAACGDNIEPIEEDADGALIIACDETSSCDSALEDSLDGWLASGAERSGEYRYTSRFSSESGFRIETEIVAVRGEPVARHASGVRPDENGALVSFEWSETEGQLGIHSDGARPVPVSTLYEDCVLDVLSVDRVQNEVTLELFASGVLKSCTFRAKDCAGDCTFGPSLDSLQVAPE